MNIFNYSIKIIIFILVFSFFYSNTFSYSESKNFTYKFEPYLQINGTDFYEIKNKNQLQLEEFSLATWFRTNQSNFNEPAHIINKGGFNNDEFGKNMNYGIWMNSDGTITGGFESQSGENFEISTKTKYNDGKWHYVIVSYSSKLLKMYIDSQEIGIIQVSKKPDITGNQPFRIGANSLEVDKFFKGEIDEVRIWNRGLTVNEINKIYDNKDINFIGQVEYLNFGKNTNNFSSKITNNNIANDTNNVEATTKPFVETISSNQDIVQLPLSNKSLFIDNAAHWIDYAKASFVIKNNNTAANDTNDVEATNPSVIFVILLPANTLEKVEATTKPFVETISSNQDIVQLPLSNKSLFIDNAAHWIDYAKASFIDNAAHWIDYAKASFIDNAAHWIDYAKASFIDNAAQWIDYAKASFIDNAAHWIDYAKASFVIKNNN